jgi:peptide/nickel transport system permease protein
MAIPSDALNPMVDPAPAGAPTGSPIDETRAPSRFGLIVKRFVRKKLALTGLAVLVLLFLLAFFGPLLNNWSYDSHDFNNLLTGPSSTHWFGTTQTGSDMFELCMRGMQKSMITGLIAAIFATGVAAIVGAFAGYLGGWVDRILMWIVDLLLVIPSFLILAIMSPFYKDGGFLLFVALLGAFLWMVTARIVRGLTISLREREYVLAARYMGVSTPRIIVRHILPNISSLLIVDATINVSAAVILETFLSYFGFGIQPPDVSLGTLIADGSSSATTYGWLFGFPGGLLVMIVLAVNLVGDGLRDALDPSSGSSSA